MSQTAKVRLLDVREAADLLNISIPFIYRAVREKRLPVTRIGRALRFDQASLERFVTRNTTDERQPA